MPNNMNISNDPNVIDKTVRRVFWQAVIVWTLLIIGITLRDYYQIYHAELKTATAVALDNYNKDLIYRRWVSMQGGVYVPVSPEVQPNPYLKHIPERDITTNSGRQLTLVNPAYLTRLIHELGKTQYGLLGHITSLKPIRSLNASDKWEENALLQFEKGDSEVVSLELKDDISYLRFMRPLATEDSCLKCHAVQGYKKGDIRGGISIAVPWAPFGDHIISQMVTESSSHGVIWLIGIISMIIISGRFQKSLQKQVLSDNALRESEEHFRMLFEKANEGILYLSQNTEMIKVNESLAKMHGYNIEQMQNIKLQELDVEGQSQIVSERIRRIMTDENLKFEVKHYHSDGHIIDLEVSSYLLSLKNENYVVMFHHDITERKRAGEKIKALLAEKELLLKEVHHRIKNNMNTVSGLMFLQLDTLKDPSAIAALNDARNRVISMMVLYDKLYRSNNFKELSFDEYFSPLVDEIIDNFPNKGIVKIEKNIDDFMIDAERLSSLGIIVNEILTNIMKYAFEGRDKGLVTVSAMASENHLTIAISDNGIGISESIDIANFGGFGFQLLDMMTRQLHGTIKIERDNGTKFILEFKRIVV